MTTNNRVLPETWPLMDDYLGGHISRAEYLTGYLNTFRINFKRDYPYIDEWIEDQNGFIGMIAEEATPEICVDEWKMGQRGIDAIWAYAGNPLRDIENQKHSPFHWAILARAIDDLPDDLKRFIDESGPIMPYLGFFSIRAVALERANIDCRKNKTLSPLLLRHMDDPRFIGSFHFEVDKTGTGVPFPLGGAIAEMFKLTQYEFDQLTKTHGMQISQDVNCELGEQTVKRVPADVDDAIIAAMKGDKKLIGIPLKAASSKIDEYNVMQKKLIDKKSNQIKVETNDWGFDSIDIGKTKPKNDADDNTEEWSSRAGKFKVAEIFVANEEFKRDSRKTRSTSRQARSYRKRKFEKDYLPETDR